MRTHRIDIIDAEEKKPLLPIAVRSYATFSPDKIKQLLLEKQIRRLIKKRTRRTFVRNLEYYALPIGIVVFIGALGGFIWCSWDALADINTNIMNHQYNLGIFQTRYLNNSCPTNNFFYHSEADFSWLDYDLVNHLWVTRTKLYHIIDDYCDGSSFAKSIISSIKPSLCAALVYDICNELLAIPHGYNDRNLFYVLFVMMSLVLAILGPGLIYQCIQECGQVNAEERKEIVEQAAALELAILPTSNVDMMLDVFVKEDTRIKNKNIRLAVLSFFTTNNIAINGRDTAGIIFEYANIHSDATSANQINPLPLARRNTQ